MDFKDLSDGELKGLVASVHAELDRRNELEKLPNDVRSVALKWAEAFPEDPDGWRSVTL